jgi:hypothetical protein
VIPWYVLISLAPLRFVVAGLASGPQWAVELPWHPGETRSMFFPFQRGVGAARTIYVAARQTLANWELN